MDIEIVLCRREEPLERIMANVGHESYVILAELMEESDFGYKVAIEE